MHFQNSYLLFLKSKYRIYWYIFTYRCFSSWSYVCQLHLQNNLKICILAYLIIFWSFSKHSYEFWIIFVPSIFVKKYPLIFLWYFRYIRKIEVSTYSWLPIFSSLTSRTNLLFEENKFFEMFNHWDLCLVFPLLCMV